MNKEQESLNPKWVYVENGKDHKHYLSVFGADGEAGKGDYKWCLHCQRAYSVGNFKYDEYEIPEDDMVKLLCPYEDCDGDYWIDGWPWSEVSRENNYGEVPELGVVYPLYGMKEVKGKYH